MFEMLFTPSIMKHTLSKRDIAFRELVDEKLMKDFFDAFFAITIDSSPEGQAQRIP